MSTRQKLQRPKWYRRERLEAYERGNLYQLEYYLRELHTHRIRISRLVVEAADVNYGAVLTAQREVLAFYDSLSRQGYSLAKDRTRMLRALPEGRTPIEEVLAPSERRDNPYDLEALGKLAAEQVFTTAVIAGRAFATHTRETFGPTAFQHVLDQVESAYRDAVRLYRQEIHALARRLGTRLDDGFLALISHTPSVNPDFVYGVCIYKRDDSWHLTPWEADRLGVRHNAPLAPLKWDILRVFDQPPPASGEPK